MPRIYRVPYTGTITNAGGDTDFVSLTPGDDKPIRLIGWILSQSSEFGDAQEESIRLTVRHMTATVTITGGTSVTPVANRPGTAQYVAAGFTAKCNHTTVATTSGTSVIMEELGWNLRNTPWERWIPEEMRPEAMETEYILLRMESTLADDITAEMVFFVEEC
jgi:hypothetical protein